MKSLELTALATVLGVPWTSQACVRFSPRRERPIVTDMTSFTCFAFNQARRVPCGQVPREVVDALEEAAICAYLEMAAGDVVGVVEAS